MKNRTRLKNRQEEGDILDLVFEDHKPLKQLLKIMKDFDKYTYEVRKNAFDDFAPMFIIHSKPEELSLYAFMKDREALKASGYINGVQHDMAEQLINRILATENEDLWSAQVKNLAVIIENHIEEEENVMFSEIRKNSDLDERAKLGTFYMQLKTQFDAEGNFRPINQVSDTYIEHHMHH